MRARALCAALVAAAACRSARPVTPGPAASPGPLEGSPGSATDAGVALAPADGGAAEPDALASIDSAFARGDSSAGIAASEDAALRAADPAPLLLRAARARKARVLAALSAVQGAGSLPGGAADAQACAADAHRAWAVQFPSAGAQVDGTHPAAEVYAQVGAAGAEALYLEAVCAAAWARTQGFTQLVERRVELIEELRRAAQLAPALDGAGPDRELGALYAALPAYAGGDLAEARRHFEAAVARAPGVGRNHLEFARAVGVKAQDRQIFEAQLKLAAADEPAAAADLLAREDDLFGPAEAAQPSPGGPQR